MRRTLTFSALILLVAAAVVYARSEHETPQREAPEPVLEEMPPSPDTDRPHMQVVFALDATGSMSGLIKAAKEKIWSIAGSLSQTDPAPRIEIGLIFYRDRGDEFITKKVKMREDLDAVYEQLMDIRADGGGDGPESVNQALDEAVNDFAWSQDSGTYKTLFLVGDFPPHMNYDEVRYPATCTLAARKGIIINTILMGNNSEAERIWKKIAAATNGSFTQTGMDVNDIAVNTPYDEELSQLSDQLDELRYAYGRQEEIAAYETKKGASRKIASGSSVSTKAQRAEYNNSLAGKGGYAGSKELLNDVAGNKIKLADLEGDALPAEFKNLKGKELETAIRTKLQRRDSLTKQLNAVSRKRQEYIDKELAKQDSVVVKKSFNYQIYDKVKEQASKKNIKLKEKAKF